MTQTFETQVSPLFAQSLAGAADALHAFSPVRIHGEVVGASGLAVELGGLGRLARVGDRVAVTTADGQVPAEIVAIGEGRARALAFGSLRGVAAGAPAVLRWPSAEASLSPSEGWLGRVVCPFGLPLDGKGPLPRGPARATRADPPPPTARSRLGARIALGVRALDLFTTTRAGQRLGLFAGSGVGKSTLMGMLARFGPLLKEDASGTAGGADCCVLALVGERGREVRDFLEDELGPEGLARSCVVVATSDQPPLMRREAAYAALTIAEALRDEGRSVLLLMDSVTRFCLALREVALSAGEPPATRGWPPSVFAELPRLLERAGPGLESRGGGQMTALFTVLVEGDDHNEPVSDAVRGILDGHIVLDRKIGETGRYPAIDVLKSLSRTVPGCLTPQEAVLAGEARAVLSLEAKMADLVRLGAYRAGTDSKVDRALRLAPRIETLLSQGKDEPGEIDPFTSLEEALHG
jgi:flagellum-specific ATP synthase